MNALLPKTPSGENSDETKAPDDRTLSLLPTASDYAAAARRRAAGFLIGGGLLALVVAGAFAVLDNILLPLTVLVMFLTPVLLWRYPRLVLFFTLAAACLVELGPVVGPDNAIYKDSLTDRIPLFWNTNTIFHVYAHSDFKGIPLNLFELIILVAGVCSCLRSVYTRTVHLEKGLLFVPIAAYLLFVLFGWINGVAGGGDFKISLQEVRPQFYFGLAYLMTVSMVRERRHLVMLLWVTVLCIGLKAVLLTFRRYVTLAGQPISDQGVGAHEEAFFLNCFVLLLFVLTLCRVLPRLRWFMWALLPCVVLGNLALNRRTATAAMLLVLPLLLLAAYRALPDRRRLIVILSLAVTVVLSIYYPLFKNSNSMIGQPARAIKSNFEPDSRDASSNASRDAENVNLMATIRSAPLQGYGYGRPYLSIIVLTDVIKDYELEPYIPHNQILWIWERVGSFGFLAFWMMISAILIFAGRMIQLPAADNLTKAIGIFAMLTTIMLVLFGLLDLQLSNFRDVLFSGIWVGILAATPNLQPGLAAARFAGDGYARDGYARDGYARDGYARDGYARDGQ